MASRQIFLWRRSQNKLRQEERWLEFCCLVGLFLAALILFGINLGSLPLRDWDEGTVAQVAKEIWQAPDSFRHWLFPTLWNKPYWNKPPLVHGLIALTYSLGGVNELTSRLPGALLTAISVVLLYSIGKEIFVARIPALFSALVYLTLLPVVRQGRLAMLDGPVLCFALLFFWGILRSRRDLRWTLVAGLGLGLVGLTKGIMALLLGAIALLFLWWDTPRLLTSIYLLIGILIGCIPAIGWYGAQWLHYRHAFVSHGIFNQSLARVWSAVEGNQAPPWYYLLELLKYAWPWLIFAVYGLKLAWSNRHWSWAKLVLTWIGVYLTAVSLMTTKLPWYILPLYPAFALAAGAKLYQTRNLPPNVFYPRTWAAILGLLAILTTLIGTYLSLKTQTDLTLFLIFAAFALTLAVGAVLIARQDKQFVPILLWGTYVSLLLFFSSSHWIWELNEAYPVKPIAALIKNNVPANEVVYTSFDYSRPSLNFYSEHLVIPAGEDQDVPTQEMLKRYWQELPRPYFLIDVFTAEQLNLPSAHVFEDSEAKSFGWLLVTKKAD